MRHQYYCERPPIHVALATHRVTVTMDRSATSTLHVCKECYAYVRTRMVIVDEIPLLSIADWERILEKNHLSRQSLDDLRVLAMHKIGRKKRSVFGVCIAGDYWLLYVDIELLVLLKKMHSDEAMQQWSGSIATLWGASLGLV